MNVERIKELMKEKGLTQEALGKAVGVSHVFIGYMLKGQKMPSVAVLVGIAKTLGSTVDELLVKEV